MAMKRVCDICGAEAMKTCYEFSAPSVLIDNDGRAGIPFDSSGTDACPACIVTRQADIVAMLVKKAQG